MTSAPKVEFMRYSFTAHTCKVHTQYFHWESTAHELSSLFVQSEENSLNSETIVRIGSICKILLHISVPEDQPFCLFLKRMNEKLLPFPLLSFEEKQRTTS